MTFKESMTDAEFRDARIQWTVDRQSQVSEKQKHAECAPSIELHPEGDTFPFQCSCGEIHQFEYTENAAGVRRLEVKL